MSLRDDQLEWLEDAISQVLPLSEKYGMEDDDWLSLVAELAAAKWMAHNPLGAMGRAHRGPTLLTEGLPKLTSEETQERKEEADTTEHKVHAELERALAKYLDREHDGAEFKRLLSDVAEAIREHHYYTGPDDAGGLRQRKIGAVVEDALAYSRGPGRPHGNQEFIDQIVSVWRELIQEGKATPYKCPRSKIVARLSDINLSEDQVRRVINSPAGKAAVNTRLIDPL
ncbi:hypothetical protein [Halomonas elongata]|uniref:Uncharacterized protein n=1 Tax=Halomonas elongata (strain ATCC 33173 / DSM 2581 / NBRC 15536 / NCIMB 2198 / 1H9) TaxID=768066 RepID=A0A1R4A461_HALED|nr:hypothetical protein [Halomonas elongata]WBF18788.1 hypothetical protein LM502_03520 [Halomonas elongata]WPU47644.1 hypothetical protein SR933_01745 [Halomonas elongata DSM 2581]SJK83746.1 uncharacterized protein HELO_1664A [Halomonas elongata DSM 2581]